MFAAVRQLSLLQQIRKKEVENVYHIVSLFPKLHSFSTLFWSTCSRKHICIYSRLYYTGCLANENISRQSDLYIFSISRIVAT